MINVLETIGFCKKNNISGAVLSIDQAKAFDSVSHPFMHEVYKFFNFGNSFIDMLETMGNNRTACISMEDGSLSRNFDLEVGRTQGDAPSPVQYNMAQQICIFKIELDPAVASVYQHMLVPRPVITGGEEDMQTWMVVPSAPPAPCAPVPLERESPALRNECERQTDKSDAFADDTTVITLLNYSSLLYLKSLLEEFATFSGLRCNFDKTNLMQIGNYDDISDDIKGLGYNVVDSLTLLGMDIDNRLENLDTNFEKVVHKIRKTVTYWERFHLSLPGRINVVKSLLLPLITHLGTFLSPSENRLKVMQKIIDGFAIGSLNVSKERIYLPVEMGGLGLFNLSEFLTSMQASWVIKAEKSLRDNWRYDIFKKSHGNVLNVDKGDFSLQENPGIFCLIDSFNAARLCWEQKGTNYLQAIFFKNRLFNRGPREKDPVDEDYILVRNDLESCIALARMKFVEFQTDRGAIKSVPDLGLILPRMSLEGLTLLQKSLVYNRNRLRHKRAEFNPTSMGAQLLGIKKPAKKMRAFLCFKRLKKIQIPKVKSVSTFSRLTAIECDEEKTWKILLSLWSLNCLRIRFRMFLFKFFQNTLSINTRISHFADNVSRKCTFCSINNPNSNCDESFLHLFF